MTFKEARKKAREKLANSHYWGYLIKYSNSNISWEFVDTFESFQTGYANNDNWYYIDKSGKILFGIDFIKWCDRCRKHGNFEALYPFSHCIPDELYKNARSYEK